MFRHSVGTCQRNELTRNSSRNTQPQLSQLAEPLWTDPGLSSRISVNELISTLKKKAQVGNELLNILPKSSHARKKPPIFVLTLKIPSFGTTPVFLAMKTQHTLGQPSDRIWRPTMAEEQKSCMCTSSAEKQNMCATSKKRGLQKNKNPSHW